MWNVHVVHGYLLPLQIHFQVYSSKTELLASFFLKASYDAMMQFLLLKAVSKLWLVSIFGETKLKRELALFSKFLEKRFHGLNRSITRTILLVWRMKTIRDVVASFSQHLKWSFVSVPDRRRRRRRHRLLKLYMFATKRFCDVIIAFERIAMKLVCSYMASELDLVTSHLFLIVMKISNDAAIHRILSTNVATWRKISPRPDQMNQ